MWRIFTILGLVLSIGVCTAFAQQRQHRRHWQHGQAPNVEEIFKTKDKDHDGKLSKEEFLGNVKDPEQVKRLETRFKAIDANNDGYITLDEFKAAWAKHAQSVGQHHGKKHPQKETTTAVT